MRKQHIFVNFKRFDVPSGLGGVNRLCAPQEYGGTIVRATLEELGKYDGGRVSFTHFYPEAQIPGAVAALGGSSVLKIGCQGVYKDDVAVGGNFGAFTSLRPAACMKALGCSASIIGHCEERNSMRDLLSLAGVSDFTAVDKTLNREVRSALDRGMDVLFCVGERDYEVPRWDDVITGQLEIGLDGVDLGKVVVAYEPIWSIGPGKTPADAPYIKKVASLIKKVLGCDIPVVYGGGLKEQNAEMLASIDEIDGGLIALTRFSGEIGFYPEEYLNIIRLYRGRKEEMR